MGEQALVVIDVQRGFEDVEYWGGNRNNPDAEENISRLLTAFRRAGAPIFHIRHSSTNPRSPLRAGLDGFEPFPQAAEHPGEPVLVKQVNSGFIGTDLEQRLRQAGVDRMVTVGVRTDHCVSTTARMGSDLGFEVVVVDDATWTFDQPYRDGEVIDAPTVHRVNLASLHREFATIASTDEVIEQLAAERSKS